MVIQVGLKRGGSEMANGAFKQPNVLWWRSYCHWQCNNVVAIECKDGIPIPSLFDVGCPYRFGLSDAHFMSISRLKLGSELGLASNGYTNEKNQTPSFYCGVFKILRRR